MTEACPPEPVSAQEFAALAEPLAPRGPLAVAVSGGSDSMALLHLAHRWAQAHGHPLCAVTVDHRLRPESAEEAAWVARQATALGCPHTTLVWEGRKPSSNLQAAARAARYRLLRAWAADQGFAGILLAHTLDDQAETFLLRLARGSGVDGLSAMAPRVDRNGRTWVRPLLSVSRLRLRATLFAQGVQWREDPSNANRAFARARMRALMPSLANEGADARRLAATARRMARARAALDAATEALLAEMAAFAEGGFAQVTLAPLRTAPEDIGLRALARILRAVGGQELPLRLERLERLYASVAEGRLERGRTLAGCRLVPRGPAKDRLLVMREVAKLPPEPVAWRPGTQGVWDGRFLISLAPNGPQGSVVGALGAGGRDLAAPSWIPALVRPTLPSLWVDGCLAAVPHLAYRHPGLSPGAFRATFCSRAG